MGRTLTYTFCLQSVIWSRKKPNSEEYNVPRQRFDPYAVLGLSPTATPDEITHAYRTQVRAFHPDTRTTPESTLAPADEQLRRVFAAYALLRDPQHRARYDRQAARYNLATQRRPTVSRAPAETTNTVDLVGTVRILGLTFGFRIGRPSD
jgi:curved DNA-binding protein CbpA